MKKSSYPLTPFAFLCLVTTLAYQLAADEISTARPRTWTQVKTLFNGDNFICAAGSPERLIVAAAGGGFWTTTNGVDWTNPTLPARVAIKTLLYENDRFVGVGSKSGQEGILVSTTGLDWDLALTSGPAVSLKDLTFGNDLYVAVGTEVQPGRTNGVRFVSSDARFWTKQTSTNSELVTVAFSDGQFLALSSKARTEASQAGLIWTNTNARIDLPYAGTWKFLPTDDRGFVLKFDGNFPAYYRFDGIDWQEIPSPAPMFGAYDRLVTVFPHPNGQDWLLLGRYTRGFGRGILLHRSTNDLVLAGERTRESDEFYASLCGGIALR